MSHFQGNDKIYEELRGYFPPEYDLTPDELEKEIETENKKREIALGMMRAHLSEDENSSKETFVPKSKLLNAEAYSNHGINGIHTPHVNDVSEQNIADAEPPMPVEDADLSLIQDEDTDFAPIPEDRFVTELMEPDIAHNEFNLIDDTALDEDELWTDESSDNGLLVENETYDEDEEEDERPSISITDEVTEDFDELLYSPYEEDALSEASPEDSAEKTESLRKNISWFFDFLEVFAICITCIIVIFAVFFRLTKVSGESMEDTLYENEYLVVSDFLYEPKCGDIVVLQNTSLEYDQLREPLVKRVIAVGGQSVDIASNGMVTVTKEDGTAEILDQQYIKKEPYEDVPRHFDVPEGYVFVMGDNRNHSTDSRSSLVGVVDERCIFGKALFRVLPISEFTFFENPYSDQER